MASGAHYYTSVGSFLFRDVFAAADKDKNVVFSPSAAHGALMPLMLGLEDDAAVSCVKDLYGQDLTEGARSVWQTILDNLNPKGQGASIVTADCERWDSVIESHTDAYAKTFYDVFGREPAKDLDFTSPSALATINDWVRTATESKVQQLFKELTRETTMVSVGTTYFKSPWKTAFDPQKTHDADFKTDDGPIVRVPTMTIDKAEASFLMERSFNYVSVPFSDGYEFFVVEPAVGYDLNHVVRNLPRILDDVQSARLTTTNMALSIPKISIQSTDNLTPAFSNGVLKPVFKSANMGAIQSVGFDIDEEGGEAYAAVAMFVTRGIRRENPRFELNKASVVGIMSAKNPYEKTPLFLVALRNPALG
ncbi:MAG: serpin family protein [Alphaproteobacteria bacterium]|nr:serpin family protein [Alphaproteobacteria bacterium]